MTYINKIASIAILLVLSMVFSNQNLFAQSLSISDIDEYLVYQNEMKILQSLKAKGFVVLAQNDSYGALKFYNKKAELGIETFGIGTTNGLFSIVYKPVYEVYLAYKELLFTSELVYSYSGAGSNFYENNSIRIGFNDQDGIVSLYTNIITEAEKNNPLQLNSKDADFINYKVKDFGFISITSKLEIQTGLYKEFSESNEKSSPCYSYEILENRVIFQQKGVNKFQKTDTYARVIIKTYINMNYNYENLMEEILLSNEELNEFDEMFRSDIEMSMCDTQKLLTWYGTEIVRVNKYFSMKISYLRQLGNNPPVFVEIYHFPNNDRLHELTMSYRLEDEKLWKPLYKKTLESIVIK